MSQEARNRKIADAIQRELSELIRLEMRDPRVTSALVGTSKVEQVDDNVAALKNLAFSAEELRRIDGIFARKQPAA